VFEHARAYEQLNEDVHHTVHARVLVRVLEHVLLLEHVSRGAARAKHCRR
jgi:hypothetical protein